MGRCSQNTSLSRTVNEPAARILFRKSAIVIAWVAAFVCFQPSVSAYTPKGSYIIKLTVRNMGKAKGLFVSQKSTLYQLKTGPSEIVLNEILMYGFPDKFRSETVSENGIRLHVLSGGKTLTAVGEEITDNTERAYDLYKDVLLYRSKKAFGKKLADFGVDVSVSSLGRFDRKSVFVIGAEFPDETPPQLWVDKKTFMPVRWLIPARKMEIRYSQWGESDKIMYPMHVEVYADNILEREINVDSVQGNPSFSKDLFDVAEAEKRLRTAEPVEETGENKPDAMEEVRKIIDDFRKRYE